MSVIKLLFIISTENDIEDVAVFSIAVGNNLMLIFSSTWKSLKV